MNVRPEFIGSDELNVLGEPLLQCSTDPMTGFFRTGFCAAGPEDNGVHLVAIEVTDTFLRYSSSVGNDLSTPRPEFAFPGLRPGNRWCLVAARWVQAYNDRMAPRIYLRATNQKILGLIPIEVLKTYALDLN